MREGESCIHNCLPSSSNPLTGKKIKKQKQNKKTVSQVFVDLWLLQPAARDSHYWMAGVQGLLSSQMHVSVWVSCSCASWVAYHWRLALCGSRGWFGVQSRAKSGWVFSFSPFSSCFRVPASTTDWDLIVGERRKKIWLQTIHGGNNFGTLAFRFYIPLITHGTQNDSLPPFIALFSLLLCLLHYFYGMRDLGIFFAEISSIGERNPSSHSSPVSKCSMALEMWKVK